jgi:hypothetical protein
MEPARQIFELRPDEKSDTGSFMITWMVAFVVVITLMQVLLTLGGNNSQYRHGRPPQFDDPMR